LLTLIREKEKRRDNEKDAFKGGSRQIFPPVLKVPRQCSLVLLIKVSSRKGKALGSGKVQFKHV
jgi:hypothetical protein